MKKFRLFSAFVVFCITILYLCNPVFASEYTFDPTYRGSNDGVNYEDSSYLNYGFRFSGVAEPHTSINHGYQDYFGWADRKYTYFENNSDYTVYYVVFSAPTDGGWFAVYQLLYSPDITVNGQNIGLDCVVACYNAEHGNRYSNMASTSYYDTYFSQPGYPFYSEQAGTHTTFAVAESAYQILVDEYMFPTVDVPDSDLDIVGLSCYILNDQTGSVDWEQTCKNTFMSFMNGVIRAFFDVTYDEFDLMGSDSHILEGSIVNYVPGVALAWNAPPLEPDISYSVWVDGISKINYNTSLNPITDFRNTQQVSSCAYSKLQINDSPLVQSGSVYYQYNTNQGLQTILEFIENNSSLNPPSTLHSWNRYSYVNLETTISRVYVQASKEIDGERHYGAISYVDIVDGQPIVHEGVTDSITDITPSDPETSGTTTTVGTPMTTSGNTIYTGDTITNNNEYNYIYGTGLIVGTTNPLGFIKRLFSAIFELIQSLYLAFLVPFILLGMTGSTGGIL